MQTYQQLKNQVSDLLRRSEIAAVVNEIDSTQVTNYLDEWIATAERRFYNTRAADIIPFRTSKTGVLNAGTNTIAVPSDLNMLRRIIFTVGSDSVEARPVDVGYILGSNSAERVRLPSNYGKEGTSYYTKRPSGNVNYEIFYQRFLPSVSTVTDAATRHWLLNNAGEALKYWAATEGAKYYGGDMFATQAPLWEASAADQINEIITRAKVTESAGASPEWIVPGQYVFPTGASYRRRSR